MQGQAHLTQLPEKSFDVAPGDIVGGMIYVMDKPLGIEEGMVGISVESKPYRDYVLQMQKLLEKIRKGEIKLAEVDKKTYPNIEALSRRYQELHTAQNGFHGKNDEDIINALMQDKVHVKKRHGASLKEFKNVFLSFSKYHEMKGGQSYYVNEGTGGLLFEAYKNKCGIKKKDHFATHIGKLIKDGNDAYMVKQDGQMSLGGTGPGWRKMLKTNTGKSLQKLVNPFVILLTGGLSALAFGIGMAAWRTYYLVKNKPQVANADAIIEALSTKMASKRGIVSQEIDTINGTYANGTPKVATLVKWAPGCRDLSGKLSGSNDWSSVIVTWDKNDQPVKVDKHGNILRTKEKDEKGKITSYEKIDKKGTITPVTKAEYDACHAVSDDRIAGLGESLISFISMGDRDGIGKAGQNKAIMPLHPRQGNKSYQFFGIDFGKAYKAQNPIVASLRDDFSFDNPTGRQSRFVNYSMLYDNPLREKMKGVYLLAALRDKLDPEHKKAIAKEYEQAGDKTFADKLRAYPGSCGGVDCDLQLIKDEVKKYEDLANDPNCSRAQQQQYTHYADRLKEMHDNARETDDTILNTFAERLNLTPKQIDLLENIEKLTSHRVHTTSPDGKVLLNHLRVDRADRCAWQLAPDNHGTFTLYCQETNKQNDIKQRLQALNNPVIDEILSKANIHKGKLMIQGLTQEQLSLLSQHITEQNVAQTRKLPYRTQEMKDTLYRRLRLADNKDAKPHPVIHQGPHPMDNPIVNVNLNRGGLSFRNQPVQMAKYIMPVMAIDHLTLEQVSTFVSKEENKMLCQISHIEPFDLSALRGEIGLKITFTDKDNRSIHAFLTQTRDGMQVHFNNTLKDADFDFAAKSTCDLLARMGVPLVEVRVSPLSEMQRDSVQHAMHRSAELAPQLSGKHPDNRLHP
ncbi:MAG: hypothetical protein JSR17_06230 [Proteobacteria bacterium]|nr:hypothetical protein [Pseudomonadota bacterium]